MNYAPLLVGGAIVLFGGWWFLSAKNWFKGPVRRGRKRSSSASKQRLEDATGIRPEPAA